MAETSAHLEIDRKVSILRDCCQFYLKLDFSLVAAVAALISFLKLSGDALILALAKHDPDLRLLFWLLAYGLIFELILSSTRIIGSLSTKNVSAKDANRTLIALSIMYYIQVIGHLFLIVGVYSYFSGYVQAYAQHLSHP